MKKLILLSFLAISVIYTQAQSLSPSVISSTGNYATGGGISLSYTVGELAAIQTFTSGNGQVILTQGFQQPNDMVSGLLDIEKGADGAFSVYPIPAQNTLWFGYEFSEAGKAEVSFFDITGRKLPFTLNEAYTTGKLIHSFDCTSYAAGDYVLSVKFTATGGQEKTLSKKVSLITQ